MLLLTKIIYYLIPKSHNFIANTIFSLPLKTIKSSTKFTHASQNLNTYFK